LFCICMFISPTFDENATAVGKRLKLPFLGTLLNAGFAVLVVMNVFYAFVAVYGPAGVSTACDDLREKLNSVRIKGLTKEADSRVIILERAMSNLNHVSYSFVLCVCDQLNACIWYAGPRDWLQIFWRCS
jgi:hypothetical protein